MDFAVIRHRPETEYETQERCHILELSSSELDGSVSIAQARVEPGVTTARHRLNGLTERYVMIAGRGRVEIGDYPPEDVGPGDVVLIPADTEQRVTNLGDDDLVFLCICHPRWQSDRYEDLEASS